MEFYVTPLVSSLRKTLLSQDSHHLHFNEKISTFSIENGQSEGLWDFSHRGRSHQTTAKKFSINSLQKKYTHACHTHAIKSLGIGGGKGFLLQTFSHPTSWRVEAWLLWLQKTSPQIGSATRMTTSPWRRFSMSSYHFWRHFRFFWIRRIDCYFVIGEKNGKQFIDEIHILFENITNAAASDAADVGFRPTSRIPLQASSLAWFAGNGFKMEKRSTLQEVKWTGSILIWVYPQINYRFSNSGNPIITSYVLWFWELSYINKLKYHERNLISVYLA